MANILHSSLTGSDLHESKGAESASLGQVAVATGSGTAVFANLAYTYLTGTPVTPSVAFNGTTLTATPKIQHYIVTATNGAWTQGITGITTLHGIQAQAMSSAGTYAGSNFATITSATTATISGNIVANGAIVTTGTTTVYLTVFGV